MEKAEAMTEITGICATYDRPESCRRLLKSWPPDMPLVIVDQSDEDYVMDMVPYRLTDCQVVPSREIGISAAYRLALTFVETPYFAFVEDDFRMRTDTDYGALLEILQRESLDLVGGVLHRYMPGRKPHVQARRNNLRIAGKTLHIKAAPLDVAVCLADHVSNHYVARTDFVRSVDPWDPDQRAFEHLEFSLAMKAAGAKVAGCLLCPVGHIKEISTQKYKAIRNKPQARYQIRFMRKHGLDRITHEGTKDGDIVLAKLLARQLCRT